MTSIVAPEPRVTVQVVGLGPADVRVVDTRHPNNHDIDVVRVELAGVSVIGNLHGLATVFGEVANGLAQIAAGRRGPEGMAE